MKRKNILKTLFISTIMLASGCNVNDDISNENSSNNSENNSTSSIVGNSSSNSSSLSSSSSSDSNSGVEIEQVKDKIINVYLIGGQSNAVGYGMDTSGAIARSDERFTKGFDNVLYYGAQERWNGAYPDSDFEPVKLGYGVESSRSGAEIGIASALKDSDEMNAVIKCAWGATNLYPDTTYSISLTKGTWTSPSYIENNDVDLSKNEMIGRMYSWFEDTVTKGINLLKEDGYIPVIKGMWWMQGEAETGKEIMAAAYEELLETFISDIRLSVTNITGSDCSEMPFVFGLPKWNQSNPNKPPYQEAVRNAMKRIANNSTIVNADYVDCLQLSQHDDWHFDAAGQKYLGEEFIKCIASLEEGNNSNFYENIIINDDFKLLVEESGLSASALIANYDALNEYKYGIVFVPKEVLDSNNISSDYINELNSKELEYINVPCDIIEEEIDDNYRRISIEGNLKNIEYRNINTQYAAIAYIKDGDNYLYSSSNRKNSVSYLASEALYEETENLDLIKNYVNAGVNYKLNVDEENKYQDSNLILEAVDELIIDLSQNRAKNNVGVVQNPNVGYYVKYSSSNDSIVSVDEFGNLSANSIGEAKITIECGGKSKVVNVIVEYGTNNGVTFDGTIEQNEYLGGTISQTNGKINLDMQGMVIDGDIYLAFTYTHGAWSPYNPTWHLNDNIEFKIDGKESNTIVFYDGVPTFSENISQGRAKTVEVEGRLVTTIEVCLRGDKDMYQLNVGVNGTNPGWLGDFWNYDNWYTHNAYITVGGLKEVVDLGDGIVLDGNFNEDIYTDQVQEKAINITANGANVNIMGTLLEDGVIFATTINHTAAPTVSFNQGEWYSFMNVEFHFNSNDKQFIATCRNQILSNGMMAYCRTVNNGNGYTSYFEVFIPYDVIGVSNSISSIEFTVNGWVQTGWCWFFNTNNWNATHVLTKDGITAK